MGASLLAVAGCGAKSAARFQVIAAPSPFGQVRPEPAPGDWRVASIPSGAALAYPPGWSRAAGDTGTATAVLEDARHRIVGYLNATPGQGGETLANWPQFRVHHNAMEGDRAVTSEAAGYGVRFLTGTGSCVRDRYTTVSGARYVELACLVVGPRATTVIVGAAAQRLSAQISPVLYRALSAFRT